LYVKERIPKKKKTRELTRCPKQGALCAGVVQQHDDQAGYPEVGAALPRLACKTKSINQTIWLNINIYICIQIYI